MSERDPYFQLHKAPLEQEQRGNHHILVTMPYGIGDTVYIGLSTVGRIVENDPASQVDVLCNELQREIFSSDPRVHAIIVAERTLFPTPDNFTLRKALTIDPRADGLIRFLRKQAYDAVLPANVGFRFAHALGTKVLYPDIFSVIADYLTIRNFGDAPASRRIRASIDRYFGNKLPSPQIEEPAVLYMDSSDFANAKVEIEHIKERANTGENSYIIIVAPDTASSITRPPTQLLKDGITPILEEQQNVLVYILPSFTDQSASQRLYDALYPMFGQRIQRMSPSSNPSLMFTTALIDQADMLITGDTGTMHLAAAMKAVNDESGDNAPRNKTKIIAIFGGTNPGLYGYRLRTRIIGRGSKEQQNIRPGFLKEGYDPKGKDYFTHIAPSEVTQAIRDEF